MRLSLGDAPLSTGKHMDFQLKNCIVRHVNFPECEKCDLAKDMLKDLGIRFDILTCDKQGFGQITRVASFVFVVSFCCGVS